MQTQNEAIKKVRETFRDTFGVSHDLTVRSPGRVNIIGEHTDYNDGFVLPAAIDKAVYLAEEKKVIPKYDVNSKRIN